MCIIAVAKQPHLTVPIVTDDIVILACQSIENKNGVLLEVTLQMTFFVPLSLLDSIIYAPLDIDDTIPLKTKWHVINTKKI